jgi:hypothetical protein
MRAAFGVGEAIGGVVEGTKGTKETAGTEMQEVLPMY